MMRLLHAIGLGPVADLIALRYYEWARRDMSAEKPWHPDLAYVNQRIRELGGQ